MSCNVLTKERWQAFIENKLSDEESKELLHHLKGDCPHCESFLMHLEEAQDAALHVAFYEEGSKEQDGIVTRDNIVVLDVENKRRNKTDDISMPEVLNLNAASDEALTLPNQEPDQLLPAFRRMINSIMSMGPRIRDLVLGDSNQPWLAVGGLAASLFLVVTIMPRIEFAGLQSSSIFGGLLEPEFTEKGVSLVPPSISVKFAAVTRDDDGELRADRGINGRQYQKDTTLYLSYDSAPEGFVYLVEFSNRGAKLLHLKRVGESVNTRISSNYPVTGEEGLSLSSYSDSLTIVGIFSRSSLDLESEVYPLVREHAGRLDAFSSQSLLVNDKLLAIDKIYVDVGS